jgi:8-oxo-dGTP pyrophosphatase MutT (NUDIX family)
MGRVDHLRALLGALEPADPQEAAYLERFEALLALPGDVMSRDHFGPGHVTASAFVLSPDGRQLLLIEHSKLHRWLQPGGHVEPGDVDVLAACRREVAEEVGLSELHPVVDGLFDVDVHDIPALKGDPEHAHFDVRALFRSPTWSVEAGSDAKAARWVPLEEVSLDASDASVMRAVGKIRALMG